MSKHTPGPWKLAGKTTISNDGEDFCLANVGTFSIEQEEAEANARLIAVAPELLEALIGAVAQMSLAADCIENGRFDEALLHIRSLSREKHAAIAKATGQS